MVSTLSIIAIIISGLVCFLFPVFLVLRLKKRANKLMIPIVAGIIGFFVMQIMIRIPIVSYLQLSGAFTGVNIFLFALVLGFTAALFETVGRLLTIKFIMRDDNRFSAGVAHGIGHGGIEAIILVGINYITLVVYAMMINNGSFQSLIDLGGEAGQSFIEVKNVLLETNFSLYLLGGFERVVTIIIHIGLSVLTVFAFKTRKKIYVLYVLIIHTLLDFSVVILSHYGVSAYIIEVYILLFALVMVYMMKVIHKKYLNSIEEEGSVIND